MTKTINFPPPPKTVEVVAPDGQKVKVLSYSRDANRTQKVRWNPDLGEHGGWEFNPDICEWQVIESNKRESNPGGWSLAMKGGIPNPLVKRIERLEAIISYIISDMGYPTNDASYMGVNGDG